VVLSARIQLKNRIHRAIEDTGCVTCEKIRVHPISRCVKLMQCQTDQSLAGTSSICIADISLADIQLHGVHIRELMRGHALRAEELYIIVDSLQVDRSMVIEIADSSVREPLLVDISHVEIQTQFLSYIGGSGDNHWRVDSLDLSLLDVTVDDTLHRLELDELDIAYVHLRSRATQIKLGGIHAEDYIELESFTVSQQDKLRDAQPRSVFTSSLQDLSLRGLDVERLLVDGHIFLDTLVIDRGSLTIQEYMDHPRCDTEPCRAKRFLHEKLAQLSQPIRIGYLGLRGVDLRYEQMKERKAIMGLDFAPTYASAYDIGNESGQSWNLDIASQIFDDTEIDLKMKFSPASYSYSGYIGSYPLSQLNELFLTESNMKFAEGYASKTYYDVENDAATGVSQTTTRFFYDGLKLESSREKGKLIAKIEQGIANLIVQDDSNPDALSELTVSRDSTRGFFYHMVEGLKRGITSELIPGAG